MAINEWWTAHPTERYWIEITDRLDGLGSNLIAPKFAAGGKETASYTLVSYVEPGDVVLHWAKGHSREPAIVGFSTVVGEPFSSRITWQARGTSGRARARPSSSSAWEAPLGAFKELDTPVDLQMLRTMESELRALRDQLVASTSGATYFPYAFSDKRPMRTSQGYLLKFPATIIDLVPALAEARTSVARPKPGDRSPRRGTGGQRRQPDPQVRRAIEQHAVKWAMAHFTAHGYEVDDVGSTESFDVFAFGTGMDELHIEVKGSAVEAMTIELTDGEVKHWGEDYERVLVVVDQIAWSRAPNGDVQTSGGRGRVWRTWQLDDVALVPTRYRYPLPPHSDIIFPPK